MRPLSAWIVAAIMARVAMRVLTCLALSSAFVAPPPAAPVASTPAKVVANDAQTGLKGLELKNAAADAKSGDDVSAALKARRSK